MYDNSSDNLAVGYALGRDANNNNGNNGNGFWGGDGWWAIIIFAMIFGWGNNGWGGFGGGNNGANAFLPYAVGANGALTRGDLCSEFSFNDLQNAVRGVQQGICDSTFALNNTITNGFAGVNNAVCNLGYEQAQLSNATNVAIMQGNNALSTQLASCCCDNRVGQMQIQNSIDSNTCATGRAIERGFADTNYNLATNTCAITTQMANNTRDIIDSQNAGTRAILDYLCQEKISDLQAENQNLKLAASQAAQNNYLVNTLRPCPQPAYLTCNPFTGTYGYVGNGYNGYGYNNNGCGCGCGCNN